MELSVLRAAEIQAANCPVLLLRQPGAERVIPIAKDFLSFGADPGVDIVLRGLGIGPRHGVLQKSGAEIEIFALDSDRPILRNGKPEQAFALRNGDEIQIGSIRAIYLDPKSDLMPPGFQLLSLPIPPELLAVERAREESHRKIMSRRPPEDFHRALLDALRSAPWLLVSAGLHALIAFILLNLVDPAPAEEMVPPIVAFDLAELDREDDAEELEESTEVPEAEEMTEAPVLDDEMVADAVDPGDVSTSDLPATDDSSTALIGAGETSGSANDLLSGARLGGGAPIKGLDARTKTSIGRFRASGLDLVFVVDATGSMGEAIDGARSRVSEMIALTESLGIEFRIGVVAFRDKDDDYVTRKEPLTANRYKAVSFLDTLTASGGGDVPEAVERGMADAMQMNFSSRAAKVIVLIGDAPPHREDEEKLLKSVQRFADTKACVHAIYTDSHNKFYSDDYGRKYFDRLATAGQGQCIDLKTSAKIVEEIVRLALGVTDERAIRTLMDGIGTDLPAKILRGRLESQDVAYVTRQLSRPKLDPVLPLELMRRNHKVYLPAYINALRDEKAPLANRWLATVLLKRLIQFIDRYEALEPGLVRAVLEYSPELNESRAKSLLDQIAKGLYDGGLMPRPAVNKVR